MLARDRAIAAVMLGSPPAAIAADLGCDVATLMGWVRARRQELLRAARQQHADDADDMPSRDTPSVVRLHKQALPADCDVVPENSDLVAAAYRAAEFDYSGRRIRPH